MAAADNATKTLHSIPTGKRSPAIKAQMAQVYAQLAVAEAIGDYAAATREQTKELGRLWKT